MISSKNKKKILLITGSRSDYGLLTSLIKEIKKKSYYNLKIIATGSHFDKNHGYSIKEILHDKIKTNYNLKNKPRNYLISSILSSSLINAVKFSKILDKEKPNAIIILGDRHEILPIAFVSYVMNHKLIHFGGGESTPNNYDEGIRHSLSFFSTYHFVTNLFYKKNLIKMGINKRNIFVSGSLGIDKIINSNFKKKKKIPSQFKKIFNKKCFLVTFHPTTKLTTFENIKSLKNLLEALKKFKDFNSIITLPANDKDSFQYMKIYDNFSKKNKNFYIFKTLGHENYINFASNSDLIIGNSSSGILEIPSLKKISINVGLRQKGRIFGNSVINVNTEKSNIIKAIKKGLSLNKDTKFISKLKNPYGDGFASLRSHEIFKKII